MQFALFLFASALAMAGPIYTVTDLGSLGGSSAQAFGLSPTGEAAGFATNPVGGIRAFSSTGPGLHDLGDGQAAAVNAGGQVAGTQYIDGQPYATVWNQWLGPAGSYGMAINAGGDVAGSDNGQAFRTVNGAIQDLGAMPGGTWSSAYAINDAGDVAGYGYVNGVFRAFEWSSTNGYTLIGAGPGYAMGLNNAGDAVGSMQSANGYMHAFLFDGTMRDLGTFDGGSSYAYGINDAGDIVGYAAFGNTTHAFLFHNGLMIDLNDLIAPGWTLTEAYAINANGQIVGSGIVDGVEHAFRLDPVAVPEPSAWALTLLGLFFGFRRARRTCG